MPKIIIYYCMDYKNIFKNAINIHFIGIGGIGMSSLAKYCLFSGKTVSGSDKEISDMTKQLESLGAKINYSHQAKNVLRADLVVYTSAVNEDNIEVKEAKRQNITLIKRSEFLGQILSGYSKSVSVCGSHGKTTATAMLANILVECGKSPTAFIGGEDDNLSNFCLGGSEYAVAETCEYKKNMLDVNCSQAVILNIDDDHPDSYKSIDEIVSTFNGFLKDKTAYVNADDVFSKGLTAKHKITFGINNTATYRAKNVQSHLGAYSFTLCEKGVPLGEICLKINGFHNVYNALAVASVALNYKLSFANVKYALENFVGVKRRSEYIGKICTLKAFCDYAHHPSEIEAIIKTFNESLPQNYITVFQPHTFSRTVRLMDAFIKSLSKQDNLIIYKTYSAREKFLSIGSAKRLYRNINRQNRKNRTNKTVFYADNPNELKIKIEKMTKDCCKNENGIKPCAILFLGAGDIYEVAKNFIK